jgi:hypothetical protein
MVWILPLDEQPLDLVYLQTRNSLQDHNVRKEMSHESRNCSIRLRG